MKVFGKVFHCIELRPSSSTSAFNNATQRLGLIANWNASAPVMMQCIGEDGVTSNYTDVAFLYQGCNSIDKPAP